MWSFDANTRSWFSQKRMPQPRQHFGFVVAHLQIYVIGGQDSNQNPLNSVIRYDPVNADWHTVEPMKVARFGASIARYGNYIWIAGGVIAGGLITATVERYDLLANQWILMDTNLRIPRCFGKMCTIDHYFYIIGGADRTISHSNYLAISSIDYFNIKEGHAWVLLDEMNVPRYLNLLH